MAGVIFADGYLDNTENYYKYYIPTQLFDSFGGLDSLKGDNEIYEHELESYTFEGKNIVFNYKVHENRNEQPLADFKSSTRKENEKNKEKKQYVARSIVEIAQREQNKGFFVLPIPSNFLVDLENKVSFIYKATPGMPITKFGFNQLFSHVKRLIIFLYVEESFDELLDMKKTQTDNQMLIDLSKSQDFEELLQIIKGESSEPVITETKKIEPVEPIEQTIIHETVTEEKTEDATTTLAELKKAKIEKPSEVLQKEKIQPKRDPIKKEPTNRQVTQSTSPQKQTMLKIKGNSLLIGLLVALFFSVSIATYFVIDKITYPSQVTSLKKDVKEYQEKIKDSDSEIEKLETAVKKEKENKEKSQTNTDKKEKELQETVKALKDALEQNKKLRERIDKGGTL